MGLQNHRVTLTSPVSDSYRCTRAANSVDLDVQKKSTHDLQVQGDFDAPFSVGLIVGASGSGKTTLARQVWGDDALREVLDLSRPVIEQFPDAMTYDDCVAALCAIGLSQVPCWIRPACTLSNGQRARAEAALRMANAGAELVVIDEWTSVVDRTVAKAMSHCVQRHARAAGRRIVLLSCHYDVTEWLQPDWVLDCNTATFADARGRRQPRTERLQFDIHECEPATWRFFSKYHYLSERLPGGKILTFGVWHEGRQIGFQCFANYVPRRRFERMKLHSNRTVIHPDFVGFGLGGRVINETSRIVKALDFDVWAKFSSTPVFRAFQKVPNLWALRDVQRKTSMGGPMMARTANVDSFRQNVKWYSFEYVGS